tara:strand:- start:139 stop:507 length:369 start_codon:yes stop_codon:yes gene_type:complete
MFKKLSLLILISLLSNCASPGTAFLGPTITGAKTGSLYQASISYGSGSVMRSLKTEMDNYIEEKKVLAERLSRQTQKFFFNKTLLVNKDLYRVKNYTKTKINSLKPLRVKTLKKLSSKIKEI